TSLYTAYQTSFPYNTTCSTNQYFDVALLQCSPCPQNAQQSVNDPTQCDCVNNSYYYDVNQGGGSLNCILCSSTYTRSSDGFGCIASAVTCNSTISNAVLTESDITGNQIRTLSSSSSQPRLGGEICTTCQGATWPDVAGQRCMPCASVTPRKDNGTTISCCAANSTDDGVCLTYVTDTVTFVSTYLNTFSSPALSTFIQQHLKASFYLCRMNLNSTATMSIPRILLTNATACQVLANIAAMQFYYDSSGYAYTYYNTYIWNRADKPAIWAT
ncbi:unnamed protein product, partial [Adineta steineri]